jgi:hypothetical protein
MYKEFLPPKEALAKYRAEQIEPHLDTYRLSDHDSLRDFNRRKGEVVHSSRFLHQLRNLEPRLIVQRQVNFVNDWGLYIQHDTKLIFICQISKGWMTEFSWTEVDDQNLPSDPHWGWRTVLVRLMGKGVLTWEQVVEEFGNSQNANSDRWWIYTAPFRNHHASGIVHHNLKAHFENC